jgi:hypothetical protein
VKLLKHKNGFQNEGEIAAKREVGSTSQNGKKADNACPWSRRQAQIAANCLEDCKSRVRILEKECSPLTCIHLLFKITGKPLFAGFPIWVSRIISVYSVFNCCVNVILCMLGLVLVVITSITHRIKKSIP